MSLSRDLSRPLTSPLARAINAAKVAGIAPPGAPTIGTATAGNAQATVTFTAPASSGGGPITSYTATSSPGGFTATGAGSPLTVTGLTNATAYTFTVKASNAGGAGPASAASNSVTPEALGPELLANGGFDTDTVWTKGAGWTISAGKANASSANSTAIDQTITSVVAGTYRLTYTVSGYVSGSVRPAFGGLVDLQSANGTFSKDAALGGGQNFLAIGTNGTIFTGSIDNVSLKKVG